MLFCLALIILRPRRFQGVEPERRLGGRRDLGLFLFWLLGFAVSSLLTFCHCNPPLNEARGIVTFIRILVNSSVSLSEIKSEHTTGVIRRELVSEESAVAVRPCSERDGCNTPKTRGVCGAGAARKTTT